MAAIFTIIMQIITSKAAWPCCSDYTLDYWRAVETGELPEHSFMWHDWPWDECYAYGAHDYIDADDAHADDYLDIDADDYHGDNTFTLKRLDMDTGNHWYEHMIYAEANGILTGSRGVSWKTYMIWVFELCIRGMV